MIISRREYDALVAARDDASTNAKIERSKNDILERQVTQQQTLMSFLCSRLTAVEKERAVLLEKVAGIAVPAPTFTAREPVQLADRLKNVPSTDDVLGPLGGIFEDMGDREAVRMGVDWNKDGSVRRRADELTEKR